MNMLKCRNRKELMKVGGFFLSKLQEKIEALLGCFKLDISLVWMSLPTAIIIDN